MLGHSSGCRENARFPGCLDLGALARARGVRPCPCLCLLHLWLLKLRLRPSWGAASLTIHSGWFPASASCPDTSVATTPCSQILGQAPTSLPCLHSPGGSRSVGLQGRAGGSGKTERRAGRAPHGQRCGEPVLEGRRGAGWSRGLMCLRVNEVIRGSHGRLLKKIFFWLHTEVGGTLVPQPGVEPVPPALEGRVSITEPPGNQKNFKLW